jgi:hypothetical protein
MREETKMIGASVGIDFAEQVGFGLGCGFVSDM